jgi:hypothetical protein
VFLAASTHPGEEAVVLDAHRRAAARLPGLLTVVVPRHPHRGPAVVAEAGDLAVARRAAGEAPGPGTAVYVADTLGELGLFYRLAGVCLVGGSLVPHGGQNPLEPARLDCPILLGPHTANFAEPVARLLAAGGALRVEGSDSAGVLATLVAGMLSEADRARRMAEAAAATVSAAEGLPGQVADALLRLLPPSRTGAAPRGRRRRIDGPVRVAGERGAGGRAGGAGAGQAASSKEHHDAERRGAENRRRTRPGPLSRSGRPLAHTRGGGASERSPGPRADRFELRPWHDARPGILAGERRGLLPCCSSPVAAFYAAATARRMRRPGWRAPVPVICCGNATAGGSGKTTAALDIGRRLANRGIAVHFLLRGYGGTLRGPLRVDPAVPRQHGGGRRGAAAGGGAPGLDLGRPRRRRAAPPWRRGRRPSSWTTACRTRRWRRTCRC